MTINSITVDRNLSSHRTKKPDGPTRHPTAGWIALGVAVAAWVGSVTVVSLDDLGPWGLLPALPLLWYAALGSTVGVCIYGLIRKGGLHRGLLTAGIGSLIAILYGTTALIEGGPRFAWTYKHIGVTQFVLSQGGVDPSIDIYQRWPGSFALGAYLSELMGISDPAVLATWAQLFYAVLLAVLVFALGRSFSTSARAPWIAALIFSVTNWTGQLYYAPQPLALALHLSILLVVIRFLRREPNRLGSWIQQRLGRGATDADKADRPRHAKSVSAIAVGAVLSLQLASTVTHQLTPYVTVASVLGLVVLGYVRSWWLVGGLILITGAYLLPNLQYVQDNYALFNSINPFANFRARSEGVTQQLDVKVTIGRLAPALSLVVAALAVTGIVSRWRRGGQWPAVMCVALIATPLTIGFVQNYGGEAQLRAFLFTSPWCAIAIGWLLATSLDRRTRSVRPAIAITGVLAVLLLLFVPNFFGNEDVYYVPQSEVTACQWLSDNAPSGAVYVQSVPGFPARCSADYYQHVGPSRGDTPSLLSAGKTFGANDFSQSVPAALATVQQRVRAYGKNSLLIFSTSQERYARAWGLFGGADGYRRMQQAIDESSNFRLVFRNADTAIYSLVS